MKDHPPTAVGRALTDGRLHSLGEIGLQQFAPYLMNRIIGRYNATIRDDLKARNLTTPQMRALAVLAVADGLTINELAVYTVTEQSTMSRTLDAMEAQGLVRRESHQTDNRVRQIYLTEAGRAQFDEMWPTIWNAFSTMFRGVSDAEYETFLSVLHKMLRNVRQHEI
ncbi:MarR family transcriptional regulator [Mesorhizobium sp. J18]|uniref:MarR family winged helix-turn-helix transcriptional regulator n=1 Tax=Mesorhizobium sp. J18 TaxID=935263 RepID=UPI001FF056A9|nr:MarR family transcriptional regulator [Mesorhizobium sp. J18]